MILFKTFLKAIVSINASKNIIFWNSSLLRFDRFQILLEAQKRLTLISKIPLTSEFFSCNILLTSEWDKSFPITNSFILSTEKIFETARMKEMLTACGVVSVFLSKVFQHNKKTNVHLPKALNLIFYVISQ